MYIYIHTHVHTYDHTYIHTYIRTYMHTYIYTHIHTYILHSIDTYKSKNSSLPEGNVLVCLCIHFPDDNFVEVETYRRDISDKWLFVTDCAVCLVKRCVVSLLSECGSR